MLEEVCFIENLKRVRERLHLACEAAGRPPGTVRILPVTKTHGAWAADYAVRAGLRHVGENRVQEAASKKPSASSDARWVLIGNLQSNKVRLAVEVFDAVQSADRLKIIQALAKHAAEAGKVMPILLQINAGEDPAKFGAPLDQAQALLDAALAEPSLKVEGLMTIAPLSNDATVARHTFSRLRLIRDKLQQSHGCPLPELSMGMSGDLEAAIEEGSTCIRIGSALFGQR